MAWHVTDPLWKAYAEGALDAAAEASVETHVTSCAQCRLAAGAHAPQAAPVWHAVQATITRPGLAWPLRGLRRLGIPEDHLVVVGASDALALSWGVAVGGALTAVLVTALAGARQELAFLLLVPLVQVLAVMASFSSTDALRELAGTTPLSALRVALLRTAAALTIALPATMAIGWLVPNLDALTFTWLLPALGLVLAALVLHTWLAPWPSAGVVAAAWAVVVAAMHTHLATTLAQSFFAALAVALAVLLVLRTTVVHPGGSR